MYLYIYTERKYMGHRSLASAAPPQQLGVGAPPAGQLPRCPLPTAHPRTHAPSQPLFFCFLVSSENLACASTYCEKVSRFLKCVLSTGSSSSSS